MPHVSTITRTFVRCMVSEDYIISGEIASGRSVKGKKMSRGRALKIPRNNLGSVMDENDIS